MYGALIVIMTRQMDLLPLATTAAFLVGGALWYLFYVGPRTGRESALVVMVRRVVSSQIYRPALEGELREIALERDGITHDRFDRLVKDCPILDLPGSPAMSEAFAAVAGELAERVGVPREKMLRLLLEREGQSSTVIQPGVAVPHVIVEGREVFAVVLLRCREGIRFPGQDEPVRVGFVLVGSADERNYHLRALMAIGHIIQEHDFARRWLDAPDAEHLRDILLLSGRSRDAPAG